MSSSGEQDPKEIIKSVLPICYSYARDIIMDVIVVCLQIMKMYSGVMFFKLLRSSSSRILAQLLGKCYFSVSS